MHVIETALCTLNCCLKSLFRIIYEAHLGVMKGKNFRKFEKISFFCLLLLQNVPFPKF